MRAWARRQRKRGRPARRFIILDSRPWWQARVAVAFGSEDPRIAGELRLWAKVLDDAVTALCGRHPLSRPGNHTYGGSSGGRCIAPELLWREAVAWILSRELEPLGTFESVCEVLELPVDEVRRDLCALATQHAPAPASAIGDMPESQRSLTVEAVA